MTPPLQWVFLLALVGSVAGLPKILSRDACAILCQSPVKLSPAGVCELSRAQSGFILDQARTIANYCLNHQCDHKRTVFTRINCQILLSLLENHRGCCCSLTKKVVPNNEIVPILVNELADDLVSPIFSSTLGKLTICALHTALSLENIDTERTIFDDGCYFLRLTQDLENVHLENQFKREFLIDSNNRDKEILNGEQDQGITEASHSSEEDDIDWEKWCMSQCYNGHGGNACRCDLIP